MILYPSIRSVESSIFAAFAILPRVDFKVSWIRSRSKASTADANAIRFGECPDRNLQARVWAGGHQDRQVAISGKLALTANPAKPDEPPTMQLQDPQDNTVRGVVAMLAPWLAAGGKSPATDTESQLATSAEAKEWMKIVVLTDNLDKPTPRQRYYRILALVHTDRRPEAETAVAAFRAEKPNHVLLNALDDLLAPVVKPYPEPHEPDINNATPVDDGGNVLR